MKALLLLPLLALGARAQERGEGPAFLTGGGGDSARYQYSVVPGGDVTMDRHELGGSKRILEKGDDAWSVNGRLSRLEMNRSPVIPATGLVVPSRLYEVSAGASFLRKAGERRNWGAGFGVGSASDRPFDSMREAEFRANVFKELPSGERDSWLLFLAYSNNRTFLNNVPFPGAAYVFRRPEHGLRATVGIPFATVSWEPTKDWRLGASAFGPTNLSIEGARRVGEDSWAYARVERAPSQWLRAGREERRDRLIYDRAGAMLGFRGPAAGNVALDFSFGREFRRRFLEARDASRKGAARADLPDAWAMTLRVLWRAKG